MYFFNRKRGRVRQRREIDPDEILIDAENLPGFDTDQFEGRIEKPIAKKTFFIVGLIFLIIGASFLSRIWFLQITEGQENVKISEQNRLRQSVIFADRGIIYDINNNPLVWNEAAANPGDVSQRRYIDLPGFADLLGYVTYPKKDNAGFYFAEETMGVDGLELIYNDFLSGENGSEIIETNALGETVDTSTIRKPVHGGDLHLTIDRDIQSKLQEGMARIISERDFRGGGGVIMDVWTGDILALVSLPEYDSNVLSEGQDEAKIQSYIDNPQNPFLDRVTNGQYTPGSIVKPFIALAALSENIINPLKEIYSAGKMYVPNPYDPEHPSVFSDWKAHGAVDMRKALAVSSNIYFYQVGGGFEDQPGLGISNINKYMRMFGFGESISTNEFDTPSGVVPNPEWKRETFDDDWRLGDTYFTSIGQYGFLVNPLQMVVAVATIANEGTVLNPRLVSDQTGSPEIKRQVSISREDFQVVKEGMRQGVTSATVQGLNYPDLEIAGKTGTAELGESKERVNSWVTGFFPYRNPRYAFVLVLEQGLVKNQVGAVYAAKILFDWLKVEKPEYTY
ncbi:MAG TPA: penicillin-binding transpeptidase domain-containing protein [Candidatus Paceibacterota bacterium]|nr:penicillin-binding transpeptidase domain-containing protein [Candidatus Paceibacterota bacterium]HRZ34485.1 penicillin-binding transpeptidase domain-containing protein [Candidatus Paceibacterota bacterium]